MSLRKGQGSLKGFAVHNRGISFVKTQVGLLFAIAWLCKIAQSRTPNLLAKGESYTGVPSHKMERKVHPSREMVQS